MIFGIRAILEAIRSGAEIDKVYLQQDASGDLMRTLVQNLKRGNIHCAYVPVEKLNKLTTQNHQGAVATIAPIGFHELEPLIEKITAQKEHPLTAIQIGETSINGNADGLREHVRREDPGEEMEVSQISDNGRHRGRDDGVFHGCHEGRHHAGGENDVSAIVRGK